MTTKLCLMVTQYNQDWQIRWKPMNVLVLDRSGISSRHVGLLDRLITRWQAPQLDRELAHGAQPESSVLLALRAQFLVRPSERRRLARSLKRVMRTGQTSSHVPIRASMRQDAGLQAYGDLRALIERLLEMRPLDARGMALVLVLIRDGAGPLYRSGNGIDLRSQLRAAISALGPA
jgi:hypothetical protein